MIYGGWTLWWSGLVLVGQHEDGRRLSLGEVYEHNVRGWGRYVAVALDPRTGVPLLQQRDTRLLAAQALVESRVRSLGGTAIPRQPGRGGSNQHVHPQRDAVLPALERHPEGTTARALARELGIARHRVANQLLQLAKRGRARRETGKTRFDSLYFPL